MEACYSELILVLIFFYGPPESLVKNNSHFTKLCLQKEFETIVTWNVNKVVCIPFALWEGV